MVRHIQDKYIMLDTVIGFSAPFICSLLGQMIFATDYAGQVPIYKPETIVLIEFGLSFLLLGSTVMGLKLEDEKKILPAAGFTMLAISAGVMMSSLFEITQVSSAESFEKYYFITISSNFLYFPAMLLIAFYDGFKIWIRWLGLISCLPLLISSILFLTHYRNYSMLEIITNCGYLLMGLAQCIWAINIYINYKKKLEITEQ
ncbi:MAG: hypothetical protein NW207_07920 [Cytophagales bacterium]|nr:hypothetical protein [Cytophagales bacterium]